MTSHICGGFALEPYSLCCCHSRSQVPDVNLDEALAYRVYTAYLSGPMFENRMCYVDVQACWGSWACVPLQLAMVIVVLLMCHLCAWAACGSIPFGLVELVV